MQVNTFVSLLFHSRTQAHIFHLKTTKFSTHKTLDEYYSGIISLIDDFVEAYQGKYPKIQKYSNFPIIEDYNDEVIVQYFKKLVKRLELFKVKDSFLQNHIDSIYSLIYSTIYRLSLK
jgi:hypothetical protein